MSAMIAFCNNTLLIDFQVRNYVNVLICIIYLPRRSATRAPPKEPIAPPTRNTDTIADHSIFRLAVVKCTSNESKTDWTHQSLIYCSSKYFVLCRASKILI